MGTCSSRLTARMPLRHTSLQRSQPQADMIGSRRRHAAKEVTVDSLDARTKARERTARTTCTAQPDGAPPDVPRRPAAAALAALALGARSRAKATGLGGSAIGAGFKIRDDHRVGSFSKVRCKNARRDVLQACVWYSFIPT